MPTLIYVHDPMCSWCWGFAPVLDKLMAAVPPHVEVRRLLGGLAPDSDVPMPDETREYVQRQWRRIEETIPGRKFNFDFWSKCQPRRSTYPACRAVIAAREQGEENDTLMTTAIQRAYYQQARNPSDVATLTALAGEIGIDADAFAGDLGSDAVAMQFEQELDQCRTLGVRGFPSLVLVDGDRIRTIPIDYLDSATMLAAL
ncbi:MAG: DsbA family protein [Gammaproteobacteria bacterium]